MLQMAKVETHKVVLQLGRHVSSAVKDTIQRYVLGTRRLPTPMVQRSVQTATDSTQQITRVARKSPPQK